MMAIPSTRQTSSFAAGQVSKLLADLNGRIREAAQSPDPDAIHDIRVDIRKLDQALVVFKPSFPLQPRKRFAKILKRIMDLSSAVRDNDIALKLLNKSKLKFANKLVPVFTKRRKRAARAFAKALRRWLKRDSAAKWRLALVAPARKNGSAPAEPLEYSAERFIGTMARSLFLQGSEVIHINAPRKLHKFRIAAKKLRYTIQLFEPVRDGSSSSLLEHLEQVQRVLGRVNDYANTRRMVAKEGALRKLIRKFKKKQRENIDEFRRYWTTQVMRPEPIRHRVAQA